MALLLYGIDAGEGGEASDKRGEDALEESRISSDSHAMVNSLQLVVGELAVQIAAKIPRS